MWDIKASVGNPASRTRMTGTPADDEICVRLTAKGARPVGLQLQEFEWKDHRGEQWSTLPDDAPLWRYMPLGKLVSLLTSESLYFARLDKLGDPFEGAALASEIAARGADAPTKARVWALYRRWMVANCWHQFNMESDAMWRGYAHDGIAIRSTAGTLRQAVLSSTDHYADADTTKKTPLRDAWIGRVIYDDHNTASLNDVTPFGRFFFKRPSFFAEREVRVLAALPQLVTDAGVNESDDPGLNGVSVPVKLESLIDELVISPFAPGWLVASVAGLLKKFGLGIPCRVSDLSKNPQF